jgi:hypothetical protein
MFKNVDMIRKHLFPRQDPPVGEGDPQPSAGGGSGEPVGEPSGSGMPSDGGGVNEPQFQVPEGKVLLNKDEAELLNWYRQFGSPEDLYNAMVEYQTLKQKGVQGGQSEPQDPRKQELEQVRNLLFEAIPELKQLPTFMQASESARYNMADAAADYVMEMAAADQIPLEGDMDKHELLTLITVKIQNNPAAHRRFLAGDMSVVAKAYKEVVGKYYNKGNGTSAVPPQKLKPKPKVKGGTPAGVKDEEPAKDFDEAGDKAFERLMELRKGG